jgi:seryl-tRNA synthetase
MTDLEKPITTQEELDSLIGDRLKRERETISKKYGDYDSIKSKSAELETAKADLQKQLAEATEKITNYDKEIADRDAKIKSYESHSVKQRIAHEVGLPFEVADRLSGETEDDIRKDAEVLYKVFGKSKPTAPLGSTEGETVDPKRAALKKMLDEAKNG